MPAWLVGVPARRLAFAAWWLGWAALLAATLTPQPDLPLDLSDKTWHVLGFAVMTAAAVGFAHQPPALLASAGFALLMGGLVEIGQMFVPSRSPDIRDLAADTVGVTLGLCVAFAWPAAVVWPWHRRLRRSPQVLPGVREPTGTR